MCTIYKAATNDICNVSFASGIFPNRLKIAIIKPLHKKRNTENLQNYRPISLLSVFFKNHRKVNYASLMSFIVKNNILNDVQHGFCEGKSTYTEIQEIHTFLENIQKAMKKI